MNNENNNFNNGQNVTTTPVVNTPQGATTPVTTPINNFNQVNQPVNNVQPVPVTTPVAIPQPVQAPVVEPKPVKNNVEVLTVPQPTTDNNTIVNENLQKVEIKNYNPPSKFKIFILLVLFALIIAFIMFLPDISSMIRIYMSGGNNEPEVEVITTGKLMCDLSTNTTDLDKEYELEFSFTDSKLKTSKYIIYTRGDTTTESALDELNEKCNNLKEYTKDLEGISVKCEYSDGKLMEKQIFELENIDSEKLTAAFTEAGGMVPSYKFDQDIDGIEKNLKASGYTCERQK